VPKVLIPEASLLFILTAFYTADVPLTDQQAIAQDAFGTPSESKHIASDVNLLNSLSLLSR
jgi:hypothetical protein